MKNPIRVLIVDDHPIVRYGLRQLIELEDDMTVCGEAESAAEALNVVGDLDPDIVITDVSMEGRSGIELVRDLKERNAGLPVLVLSIHHEENYVERALKAGARGYLSKMEAPRMVVSAIRKAIAGEIFLCEGMATRLLMKVVARPPAGGERSPVGALSNRELEVLEMVGRGQGTKQIAEMLSLSINTIESHRRNIKQKLGIDTASELAKFATEWLLKHA